MEEYTYVNGKKLRKGFTTGTCATGAALAAFEMLAFQKEVAGVEVALPIGKRVYLPVEEASYTKESGVCFVRKDGGDDIDVTHGLLIGARVFWQEAKEITILGGEGVGLVTKKGLAQPVGTHAINPMPRQMIRDHIQNRLNALSVEKGVLVEVIVPRGEEVSHKTFNPRLGIVGGISILGTTGIVTPMSVEAWQQAISYELQIRRASGYKNILLTPGNYGETFGKDVLKLEPEDMINMSNFVGYCLDESERVGFDKVILIGHLGKLVKVAGGIFNTHSRVADGRIEIILAYAALMGATKEVLFALKEAGTTEEACEILEKHNLQGIYQVLADKIKERAMTYLKYRPRQIQVEAVIFTNQQGLLGSTCFLEDIYRYAKEREEEEC